MSTKAPTLVEELARLHELKTHAARLAAEAKDAKAESDQLEIELFERMDSEQVGSMRHSGLGINFVRAETQYGQIQDRAEFIAWAEENSPELLETKERKKLVNELVRERLDSGEALPPGCGFYVDQYISQRTG